jgi:DNA polymerase III epsilon subunit family exonuclease
MFALARTYVALDIETTGLDLDSDRITEVGAIRFLDDGTELETFQSLVNPGRPIPAFVERLTGVTNAAVAGAPHLADIADDLVTFLGDATIVGQNIGFDRAHLAKAGVVFNSSSVDTAELSRILLPFRPGQGRGLMNLAGELDVEAEEHHRALSDARTAARIFVGLLGRAREIEPPLRLQLAGLLSLHDRAIAEAIGGEDWVGDSLGERAMPSLVR